MDGGLAHRESIWLLDSWANSQFGKSYDALDDETKAALQARLKKELRTNAYDPGTGDLVVSPLRAQASAAISQYYKSLFTNDPKFAALRDDYAGCMKR